MPEINASNFSITVDLPSQILEMVLDTLGGVGIDLPTYLLQVFLFILTVTAFVVTLRRLRKEAINGEDKVSRDPKMVLVAVGLGLILCGILFAWIEQLVYPLPHEIKGEIEIIGHIDQSSYNNLELVVLDNKDNALGSGFVDTAQGNFAVFWETGFGNRPRKILITAPGCSRYITPIGYDSLRKNKVKILFECGGQQ